MKKTLFTLAIVLLAVAAQAQIKVHDNGHVSLGCLTHAFGVQVQPKWLYLLPHTVGRRMGMGNALLCQQ